MFQDTQAKILKLFRADESYYSLVVSGSGTASNETVLSSLFKGDEAILLVHNGVFGERLLELIDKYKIPLIDADFPWATLPDLNVIERKLADNPLIKVVAVVYHETSTGMINPIPENGKQNMIQVANMGEIYEQDCYNMLEVFETVVNKLKK